MTSLVMCGILFFGIISYRALPVNDLPAVDFPTIQVTAGLTGANAETMASTVATPLEKQFATIAGLGFLLLITVLVIYMVLGILYESYLHPVTILSALPLAGFGALATLMAFRMELDLYAFVGVIMLVGLVKKNGIMMIDFALETERTEQKSPEESIHHACLVRFRPIMMTTMAALLGTLPIALGIGAGGESRRPLGVAVVGGLFFSQFLTMYVTPVFYIYIDKLNRWMAERKKAGKLGS